MSLKQLTNSKILEKESIDFYNQKTSKKNISRVDINCLLIKLREKKKLQKQENLLFFGIISSIIITVGVIATL